MKPDNTENTTIATTTTTAKEDQNHNQQFQQTTEYKEQQESDTQNEQVATHVSRGQRDDVTAVREPVNCILEKAAQDVVEASEAEGSQVIAETIQLNSNECLAPEQQLPLEERLLNVVEIYNVALSPTSISIAYDTVLKTNVILKKIFKDSLDQIQVAQAIQECEVSCRLNHFNLVTGYAHFENAAEYSLLIEFVNDADYFQEKVENCHKPIKNELKLKSYMADVFNGLDYIHSQGYIHCDLKLANLFCERQENDEEEDVLIRRVKIGDFGLVQKMDPETKQAYLEETCGTFGFKAPEVKKGATISDKADIWSVGIILYLMTVAYLPHHMKGYKYGQGPIPFREFDWKKRSPELRDFVHQLLSLDPDARPTAKQALQHPFLQMD